MDDAKLLIDHLQAEADQCAKQWQAQAAWQVKNLEYRSAVAAQAGSKHPVLPPDHRGPVPPLPSPADCAPSTAFGIPASALPGQDAGAPVKLPSTTPSNKATPTPGASKTQAAA